MKKKYKSWYSSTNCKICGNNMGKSSQKINHEIDKYCSNCLLRELKSRYNDLEELQVDLKKKEN